MFYGDNVQDTRAQFFSSWEKHRHNKPLTPLESQIAAVIEAHPEYHALFDNPEAFSDEAFSDGNTINPFMHLGLHLAIRDQVLTNKPQGIQQIYQHLLHKIADPLEVEHRMMDTLALQLWEAQRTGQFPQEQRYLEALKALG